MQSGVLLRKASKADRALSLSELKFVIMSYGSLGNPGQ